MTETVSTYPGSNRKTLLLKDETFQGVVDLVEVVVQLRSYLVLLDRVLITVLGLYYLAS